MSTYQDFLRLLDQKKICPIYLFLGTNENLISESINKLKHHIFHGSDFPSLNINIFEEKNYRLSEIINTCESLPFSSPKRLVIIKNFSSFSSKEQKEFAEYLKSIPTYLHLLLYENTINNNNIVYKQAQKNGLIIYLYSPLDSQMVNYIKEFSLKNNLRFTHTAIAYIIKSIGHNFDSLIKELEKYLLYFDKNKVIDKDDLTFITSSFHEESIFELLEVIFARNLKSSLSIFRSLIIKGEPHLKIFFMITKQLRLLYQLKTLNLENSYSQQILEKLNIKSKKQVSSLLSQAKNYTIIELKNLYKNSINIDIQLKTKSNLFYSLILEMFIVDLCQIQ
ncbi:MAG: DNA polymerase III subunit delta [bacterium]|nr:DNA polymerase III subunit delta [bacterium]